ncbi:MAG: GAF domain-containing protein [Nitrospinae bacterium]|nr:GAF domain-containing protein [Nitrospinota bacterium]
MKTVRSKTYSISKRLKIPQNIHENYWLGILNEVSRITSLTLELDKRLKLIVEVIVQQTGADACSVLLMDEEKKNLILKATKGLNPMSIDKIRLKVGEGITGWTAQEKKVVALSDASKDPHFIYFPGSEEERFKSVLSVPILENNKCMGVIYTQTFNERDYTENDIKLLTTIANHVSWMIKNSMLYDKAVRRLSELSILYEISVAMQTTVNLDKILRMILGCVTAGDIFGFNRAALFLVNENTKSIQGMLGLGPDSGEEAGEIWSRIPKIKDLSQWLISQGDILAKEESQFDKFIKGIDIPITAGSGVLALTILEGKPFNIKDARNDSRVNRNLIDKLGVNSFATVPIITRNQVVGIIAVDNLYTNKPITDEDLQTLVRFSTYVGWAIENSRLFSKLRDANKEILLFQQQLIQSERLAALGELAAELAHEIKNPLVTIGGFARRLLEKGNLMSEERKYSDIIINEVERLEKLLKDILNYSRDIRPKFSENDINTLIEEVLSFHGRVFNESGIEIKKELSGEIHPIHIDLPQIRQVITNLFYNAVESMIGKGGIISVKTEPLSGEEGVTISISDTGGGIPSEILNNIFNPFFTTKKDGTGLGLSLSRKIVESHGGKIEINNRIGEGATFIINLPWKNRQEQKPD